MESTSSPPPQNQLALTTTHHPRRLPPPCWSHDETAALIDAYRDKWYSLRRGNLRANHWQEVADAVFSVCPLPTGPKTPVQCRHKMEKLRKRYRNDLNRATSRPGPLSSSWVHFNRMHAMEKGIGVDDVAEDDEEDEDEELYRSIRHGVPNHGFRIKIPTNSGNIPNSRGGTSNHSKQFLVPPMPTTRVVGNGYASFDPNASFGGVTRVVGNGYKERVPSFSPNPSFGGGSSRGFGNGGGEKLRKRKEREGEREAIGEMVAAVRALGDGFVRIERMKMEMAREVEAMRMEMEMKRTEMILESQQRIVEAFASAVSEDKKVKRMSSPES